MPFGEIFTGTFTQLWRHKRLWLFGLLGLALTSIATFVYQLLQFRWQSKWYATMGDLMQNPGMIPEGYFSHIMSTMVWLWVAAGVGMIVGLLGYIVNLVMRGATMNEAAVAWGGGRTHTGRGLAAGVGRAVYIFLIDLLWLLPGLLLGCGAAGAFFAAFAVAGIRGGGDEAAGAFVLTLITALCCVFCLALLVGVVSAVFAPLMYQSAVTGRRGLGAAISEGWRLAKANLGAMIIFAILLWVLGLTVGLLASLLSMPFAIPWLSTWMRDWSEMMGAASRGAPPTMPAFGGGWLWVAMLAYALLAWLASSFLQSFHLTLYAGVYRHLSGHDVLAASQTSGPVDTESASLVEAAAVDEPVLEAQAPAGSPEEIAVPDEAAETVEAPVGIPDPYV